MDDNTKKFLEDNFKEGEFVTLTIMVKTKEFMKLATYLSKSELTLAVIPHVKEVIDDLSFEQDDDNEGTSN